VNGLIPWPCVVEHGCIDGKEIIWLVGIALTGEGSTSFTYTI